MVVPLSRGEGTVRRQQPRSCQSHLDVREGWPELRMLRAVLYDFTILVSDLFSLWTLRL